MSQNPLVTTNKPRTIWFRALYMLLLAFAYHVSGMVLFLITVIQFVVTLLTGARNERLSSFGKSLGIYLQQIACFLTFSTEDLPFPFKDWPSGR